MTHKELLTCIGYLSNPKRGVLIEAELANKSEASFAAKYAKLTDNHPLPKITNKKPFFIWAPDKNKWGVELRLYFNADSSMPVSLQDLTKNNKRPGYSKYNKRISNNEFIFSLFAHGFLLGDSQSIDRIRIAIIKLYLKEYIDGYNL